jgi:acyl-CoA dehydrogenase
MLDLRPTRPWETDEATMFRDHLRRFLAAEAVPRDEQWRKQKHVEREFWRKAGELGFLCPSIPEEYGGGGGSFALEAVMAEELSYAGITGFMQNVHGGIVAHYLLAFATEEQKRHWLPRLCSGEAVGAIAMTEPGAGSDLQAIRTSARREGDEYVINGSKTFISNGQVADLVIVAVKTDPSLGAKGTSLVVVDVRGREGREVKGFRRGRNLDKIGMHGSDTAELFFDDLRVPVANLLGEEGQGFRQMMEVLPQERIGIAIGAQGLMERALEVTLDYVRERKAFNKRLLDLQNTRFKLADCLTQVRVSRAFLDDCIARHIRGELSAADASMAKLWCTETQGKVIDECLQLHGGYGYMNEYLIARLYADVRVQRIYGGASEVMKEILARTFD